MKKVTRLVTKAEREEAALLKQVGADLTETPTPPPTPPPADDLDTLEAAADAAEATLRRQGDDEPPPVEALMAAHAALQTYHRRIAGMPKPVVDTGETPEDEARFAAIRYCDKVPIPGLVLYKDELLALVEYWENETRRERFFEWLLQRSFDGAGIQYERNQRNDLIASVLGEEAVGQAIKAAFTAFDRDIRHGVRAYTLGIEPETNFGPAAWACYLAEGRPERNAPPSREDLEALARYRAAQRDPACWGSDPG